jgi:hypothetical protein
VNSWYVDLIADAQEKFLHMPHKWEDFAPFGGVITACGVAYAIYKACRWVYPRLLMSNQLRASIARSSATAETFTLATFLLPGTAYVVAYFVMLELFMGLTVVMAGFGAAIVGTLSRSAESPDPNFYNYATMTMGFLAVQWSIGRIRRRARALRLVENITPDNIPRLVAVTKEARASIAAALARNDMGIPFLEGWRNRAAQKNLEAAEKFLAAVKKKYSYAGPPTGSS